MGQVAGLDSILRSTLAKIDAQIHVLQNEVEKINREWPDSNVTLFTLQTGDMQYPAIPLLLARSNVLLAMAMNK